MGEGSIDKIGKNKRTAANTGYIYVFCDEVGSAEKQ
jgi:hypothetical protein